jgi:predicted amidohydrolase
MARPLTVAAAQLGPSSPNKVQTVERMVALMEEAGKQGVELLSFPELSLTPYFATTEKWRKRISNKKAKPLLVSSDGQHRPS